MFEQVTNGNEIEHWESLHFFGSNELWSTQVDHIESKAPGYLDLLSRVVNARLHAFS